MIRYARNPDDLPAYWRDDGRAGVMMGVLVLEL
jgi:hypothetical protein